MAEEIEIQTINDVKTIDYMKSTNQTINEITNIHVNQMQDISDSLSIISEAVADSVDLSNVEDAINNIDTTVVEIQTQDILTLVNEQQQEINNIKENVEEIKQLINQVLEKI